MGERGHVARWAAAVYSADMSNSVKSKKPAAAPEESSRGVRSDETPSLESSLAQGATCEDVAPILAQMHARDAEDRKAGRISGSSLNMFTREQARSAKVTYSKVGP